MKICIPVSSPDGLSSVVESNLAQARYLHIHDLVERSFHEVDLSQAETEQSSNIMFDAVICKSIHRPVFQALRRQGKRVFLSEFETVQQVLEEFEQGGIFMIPDEAGGCGGGCHDHESHDHAHGGGCQCQSSETAGGGGCGGHGGCAGHDHGHEAHGHAGGGCCSSRAVAHEPGPRVRGETLRIAVTCQNRKTVTEHAGKCRKFWCYETRGGQVVSKTLLELPIEQVLHASVSDEAHPLNDIDVLVTASIGDGLRQRLNARGIETIVTEETDPDAVVEMLIKGS